MFPRKQPVPELAAFLCSGKVERNETTVPQCKTNPDLRYALLVVSQVVEPVELIIGSRAGFFRSRYLNQLLGM